MEEKFPIVLLVGNVVDRRTGAGGVAPYRSGQLRALIHCYFSRDLRKVSHMDLSEGKKRWKRKEDGKLKVSRVGLLAVLGVESRPTWLQETMAGVSVKAKRRQFWGVGWDELVSYKKRGLGYCDTLVLPFMLEIHSKTPSRYLKSWIVEISIYRYCDTSTVDLITDVATIWLTGR